MGEEIVGVRLLNAVGQVVKEQEVRDFGVELEVRGCEAGMYFLQVESSKGRTGVRVLIE